MKTKNDPDKRRKNIINYLNAHNRVSTEELKTNFNIPKSTLSEDLKYLKKVGYPIISVYGYVSLETPNDSPVEFYEKLNPSIIRKWIILLAASYCYVPFNYDSFPYIKVHELCQRIYHNLSPNMNAMSEQVFRKDIRELIQNDYLSYTDITEWDMKDSKFFEFNKRDLILTYKTQKLVYLSFDVAENLAWLLENRYLSFWFSDLKDRLLLLYPEVKDTNDTTNAEVSALPTDSHHEQYVPANSKHITNTLTSLMDSILRMQCINIKYQSKHSKDTIIFREFECISFIYYESENELYILGKAYINGVTASEKHIHIIPLEGITSFTETAIPYKLTNFNVTSYLSQINLYHEDENVYEITADEKALLKKRYEENISMQPL